MEVVGEKRKLPRNSRGRVIKKRKKTASSPSGSTRRDEDVASGKDLDDDFIDTMMVSGPTDTEAEERPRHRWMEEVLHPRQRLPLIRKSDTYAKNDPYWQYVLVLHALLRVEKKLEEPDVVDLSHVDNADTVIAGGEAWSPPEATAQTPRRRKSQPRVDADVNNMVFDATKYEAAQDFINTLQTILDTAGASLIIAPT